MLLIHISKYSNRFLVIFFFLDLFGLGDFDLRFWFGLRFLLGRLFRIGAGGQLVFGITCAILLLNLTPHYPTERSGLLWGPVWEDSGFVDGGLT